jgi:hypothetical protein
MDDERELDRWARRHGTPVSRPPRRALTGWDLLIAFLVGVFAAWFFLRHFSNYLRD